MHSAELNVPQNHVYLFKPHTVKTYRRDKSGVRLEPANPNYPVIRLRAGQELDYFGKVTACIHRFAGKR